MKDARGHGSNATTGTIADGPAHGEGVRTALGVAATNAWGEPLGTTDADFGRAAPNGEKSALGETSALGENKSSIGENRSPLGDNRTSISDGVVTY
jgi:hypothetical protein